MLFLLLNRHRRGGYFFLKICSFNQYQDLDVEPWCSQPACYMIRGLSWRNSLANISFFVLCDTVANNQVNENLWFLQRVYHIF